MKAPHPIPDAALESDIAILGKKGRGKSFTARGLVERLLDKGRRVIVLDPLSTWWGLKAGPNAYPIPVIGGPQADLPLVDTAGEQLGRYLATADQSAVIDLGAFRKAELVRFATPFLEELYTHNRDPLWLVLEEADVFAPQQPMPDTARMLGEVDRIARRGRQFGFKLISLTQRPARLNKDVLTQLSTLIALGITSPQDRDAIKAWVEGAGDRDKAKEVLGTLASLKVGEGWVWAPDHDILERVTFPPIKTLDTSATPKAGETREAAAVRKDVDVDALRATLFAPTSENASKPRDENRKSTASPAYGAAEIAEAERRGEARGVERGVAAGWKAAVTLFEKEVTALAQIFPLDLRGHELGMQVAEMALRNLHAPDAKTSSFISESLQSPAEPAPRDPSWNYDPSKPTIAVANRRDTPGSSAEKTAKPAAKYAGNYSSTRRNVAAAVAEPGDVALNSAARKMLTVLDTNPPVRRSWQQVATLAGLKARGGYFSAGKKGLVNAGLIAEHGQLVAIATPSAGAGPAAIDPAQLVETWCKVLTGAAPKILRTLFQHKALRRQHLADVLGIQPQGGYWSASWKELRDNGLVTIDGNDFARLSEIFRP